MLFAVAYTQAPLYTSNQNQYFLHGFAQAGVGFLKDDWLTNTHDTTPLFSLLVAFTLRVLGDERFFYIFYALLMGVYLFSVLGISEIFWNQKRHLSLYSVGSTVGESEDELLKGTNLISTTPISFVQIVLAILFLQHSAGLRFLLSRTLGTNWAYLFEDGVADQRMLGPVFQPSSFGVFLALSLLLFLRNRPYMAVLCTALAASFHPTYLLPAGLLTASYLFILWREGKNLALLLKICLVALIAILPIVVVTGSIFLSSSPEITNEARQILITYRIPHHAQVSWWLDETAVVKVAFLFVAIFLTRGTRLFHLLLIPGLCAAGLTAVQVLSGSEALALLFPWRISILLVPISVTIIIVSLLARIIQNLRNRNMQQFWIGLSLAMVWGCVMIGGIRFFLDLQRKQANPEQALYHVVQSNLVPGDTFLIPLKMQDFRLATGAPIYVDFKSIPYQDKEVLEWYRRVLLVDKFYKEGDCSNLANLAEEGITKLVVPYDEIKIQCPEMRLLFQDQEYHLFVYEDKK